MLTAFAVVGELTDDRMIGPNDKNRNENVLNLRKKSDLCNNHSKGPITSKILSNKSDHSSILLPLV